MVSRPEIVAYKSMRRSFFLQICHFDFFYRLNAKLSWCP